MRPSACEMPIVSNVRSTGQMLRRTDASADHRRLLLVIGLCAVAAVAAVDAGERHPAEVVDPIARRGDVFTSSFLVRFHRSVDGPEADGVAIRNGFESVGAVSIYIIL